MLFPGKRELKIVTFPGKTAILGNDSTNGNAQKIFQKIEIFCHLYWPVHLVLRLSPPATIATWSDFWPITFDQLNIFKPGKKDEIANTVTHKIRLYSMQSDEAVQSWKQNRKTWKWPIFRIFFYFAFNFGQPRLILLSSFILCVTVLAIPCIFPGLKIFSGSNVISQKPLQGSVVEHEC